MTDSATERTTKYHYDFLDRLMQYVETGEDYYHSVRYQYNTENNLSAQFENLYGGDFWNSYVYDGANRISAVGSYNTVKGYGYDAYGRTNLLVTSQDGNPTEETPAIKVDSFTFTDKPATSESEAGTSSQISTHTVVHGTIQTVYTYTYDDNGNITSISQKSWSILEPEPEQNPQLVASYVYDSANQLVRENNNAGGFTHTWTYDNAGNITSRKEYGYTTGELETPSSVVSYTYPDTDADKAVWGDLLLSYGEQTISYDENHIGNPKSDGVRSYTWEHGRQLASLTMGGVEWNYTYNADGMRTSRTNGSTTYTYTYNGDKLTYLIANNHQMYFAYDANGLPMSMILDGVMYYYVTNVQGDVIALVDSSGTEKVSYSYDAWGNPISTTGTLASTVGVLNPLRYRSYIWDSETSLYYLQSRYYNPEIGRFLNADAYVSTGQEFIGRNMFAYCLNNPINLTDSSGKVAISIGAIVAAVAVAVCVVIAAHCIAKAVVTLVNKAITSSRRSSSIDTSRKQNNNKKAKTSEQETDVPDVTYPGDDPSDPPGDDYTWHGKEPVGGDKGAWVNEKTGEQWHPDLNHNLPKGPHWDYTDIWGIIWSVFKDGRIMIWR